MTARLHAALCVAFVVSCALSPALLTLVPGRLGTSYLLLHGLLTVLMLSVWRLGQPLDDAAQRRVLWAGVAALLVLLPAPALTSHDPQRYVWDGRVALSGQDPYQLAPDSPQLASLRAQWPTPAEHAAYATLYPPAALAVFTASAAFGPEWAPRVWKILVTLAGIATLLLTAGLLRRRNALMHLPLLGLSPLLMLETGIGAHVDVFCALAVAALLWGLQSGRFASAGAALALGALCKLLPALAFAPILFSLGWHKALRFGGAFICVLAIGYALAFAAGWQPLGSLPVFFEHWRFGAPLFALIETQFSIHALRIASVLTLLVLGLALRCARTSLIAGITIALCAALLFSPVVFPWYLCVLLPCLALAPSAFLLLWVSTAPLTYEVLDRFAGAGVWEPALWPLWALAVAWLLGAAPSLPRLWSVPRAWIFPPPRPFS